MKSERKQVAVRKIIHGAVIICLLLVFYTTAFSQPDSKDCKLTELPSIAFLSKSSKLLSSAKSILGSVAIQMRDNPFCRMVVKGYGASSKNSQQLSWEHVNAVIKYLVENQGISSDRFIFLYGEEGGDPTIVDLRVAAPDELGPEAVPAPYPSLPKR